MFLLQLLSPRVLVCNNRQAPSDEVEVNLATYLYSARLVAKDEEAEPQVIFDNGPIKVMAHCLSEKAEIKIELHPEEEISFSGEIADSTIGGDDVLKQGDPFTTQVLWRVTASGGNDVLTSGAIKTSNDHSIEWSENSFGVQENSELGRNCALIGTLRYSSPKMGN